MHFLGTVTTLRRARTAPVAMTCLLALGGAAAPADAAGEPVKIAVFNFELEDATPAAALLDQSTSTASAMDKVSTAARGELEQSGRYRVIDASKATAASGQSLRDCEGCEAGLALQLGAEQSLFGVVRRVTQTDYYVVIQIRDARTGKLVEQEEANFAGSEEGWPSGVRMLIRHQVLAPRE